ncbi:MAG: aminotransferase family protein [Ruminiclostridium sp.]
MYIMDSYKQLEELKKWDIEHIWHPYTQMAQYEEEQLLIQRAKDWYVYDCDGKEYVDGISGLWNVNVGHGREEIIESICVQLKQLDFYSLNGSSYISAIVLAKKLIDIAPDNMKKVFYCNGGSEANETAIKMVRAYWKLKNKANKFKVISMNGAWHGGTLGSLSASHIASEKRYFEPMAPGFVHIPQPNCYRCPLGQTYGSCGLACANYLREVISYEDKDTIATFIAEPIQGVGGVIIPPDEYWPIIRKICDENEILLITDEVATGFGRTGTAFAITQWGIQPDIIVCSKGISSGYLPLAAVLTTEEIAAPFLEGDKYFQHGYTTGGHPASCAAAITNIEIMQCEGLLDHSPEKKGVLLKLFKSLEDLEIVGDVRGRGFMVTVELVNDKKTKEPFAYTKKVCRLLRESGVLVRPIGNTIPFFPPLSIDEESMKKVVEIYRKVLNKSKGCI